MNLADALWLKSASALFETCPTWASRLDELRRLIENSSSTMVLRVPTDLHFGCESSKRVQCGEPQFFWRGKRLCSSRLTIISLSRDAHVLRCGAPIGGRPLETFCFPSGLSTLRTLWGGGML